MKKISFFLIISFSFLSVITNAQSDSSSSKPHFKLGAFYNTHLNYYGRTDSLKSSGFFPVAELWFDENFYISAIPVFVNNTQQSMNYAGTIATLGYQFTSDDKKWFGNFYVLKPFYEKSSQLVQSALKAQAAFSLTQLNKIINITGGVDAKYSDQFDFGATGGLDHIFRKQFADNSVFVIDPSFNISAGTQQFTKTYYKQSNLIFLPGVQQQVSEDVKKFNILSYECSLPVIFSKGKFQFFVTPAYVMPQNLVVVPGRPDLSERGKEMFYTTVGAKVTL